MQEFDVALVATGLLVLGTGLLSRPLERLPFSKPLAGLLLGIVLSPVALRLLDASHWHESRDVLVHEAARLTLAIGLMGVALRLPRSWIRRQWRPLSVALLLLMPLMWIATSLVVRYVLGFEWWVALLVGAILTPTDPVVASSIVTGPFAEKALPKRLRNLLSGESGANDGLALPLVMIGILMLTLPPPEALHEWLARVLLHEVGLGFLFGALLGVVVGKVFQWAADHHDLEAPSFLAITLALALVALGGGKLLGGSGVIAVFVAGIAFDMQTSSKRRHEEEKVQESVNLFFTIPIFALLGLLLPWGEWAAFGWKGLVAVLLILLLRRLPAVLLLAPLLEPLRSRRDMLWFGWFGPIGVAAALYAALAHERTGVPEVWTFSTLVIVGSLLAHGVTSGPFTKLYGRGRSAPGDEEDADEEEDEEEEPAGGKDAASQKPADVKSCGSSEATKR